MLELNPGYQPGRQGGCRDASAASRRRSFYSLFAQQMSCSLLGKGEPPLQVPMVQGLFSARILRDIHQMLPAQPNQSSGFTIKNIWMSPEARESKYQVMSCYLAWLHNSSAEDKTVFVSHWAQPLALTLHLLLLANIPRFLVMPLQEVDSR